MALIDKASLLFVPSVVAEGKAFNILPSGNRAPDNKGGAGYDQTRADFDFDRGSNAAATRVNASGLIEKGRENHLLQSNQFDTTWLDITLTKTSGQAGYDGSNDAWKLDCNAASSRLYQTSLSVSNVQTFSVYAKAGTLDYIGLIVAGAGAYAYFDIANGQLSATNVGTIDHKIESIGNGWYRCSIAYTGTTTAVRIYPAQGDNNTAQTSGNIYIQSAQLESGLVASSYLDSTSVTGKGGVLVDLPRINYDANGQNGSLLLEPSRQNLFTQSEYFDSWVLGGLTQPTVTANYSQSPEGLQNAYRVQLPNISTDSLMAQIVSHTSGTDMTISAWVKSASGSNEVFKLYGDYGTPTGRSSQFTATSEWQRFTFTFTPTATGSRGTGLLSINNTASDLLVYAMQIETGTYATSYIPCMGTSETRAADSCSVTGVSDVIGQSEGTLFVEAETLENGADCRITISDNTINNRVSIEWDANADTIKGFIGVGGNLETTSYDQTNRNKIAIVYNSSDARLFINGTKLQTDTSVPSLSGMDRIEFSNYGAALPFVGKVYKMYISEEKLTDAEAITLTTL